MIKEDTYQNDFPYYFLDPRMNFENNEDNYPLPIYDESFYAYVSPEPNEENNIIIKSPDKRFIVNEDNKVEEENGKKKEKEEEIDVFPFKKGEGLFNVLKKSGLNFTKYYNKKYDVEKISFNNKKFEITSDKDINKNKYKNFNKKKDKNKLRCDNIKKKLKRTIFKDLKNVIDKELEKCGINKDNSIIFQEIFIDEVSYKFNCEYLNYTLEELIKEDFTLNLKKNKKQKDKSNVINDENDKNKKIKVYEQNLKNKQYNKFINKKETKQFSIEIGNIKGKINNVKLKKQNQLDQKIQIDKEKYKMNKELLNYLKENPKITDNSDFDKIKTLEYIDILRAYFISKEFENYIIKLCNKEKDKSYIAKYINQAQIFVKQYLSKKNSKENCKNEKEEYEEYNKNIKIISYNSSEEENELKID